MAISVNGGLNWPLGNPFEYNGPTLMTSFIVYPPNVTEDQVLRVYADAIKSLTTRGPSAGEMERIKAKMQSDWYSQLEIPIQRASVVAHATLFDGNPERVNQIAEQIDRVTPEDVKAFAAKYLVDSNATIIDRVPEALLKTRKSGKEAQP